jgi:hypothetical protein
VRCSGGAAIIDKPASCEEYEVWKPCDQQQGKTALPSQFVHDRKRNGRFKARLVAGGHRQQPGVDLKGTFAAVCAYRSVRIMLAVAAHENSQLRQCNISRRASY